MAQEDLMPGQMPTQANILAWFGLAYLGLAQWAFWLKARLEQHIAVDINFSWFESWFFSFRVSEKSSIIRGIKYSVGQKTVPMFCSFAKIEVEQIKKIML